MDRHRQTRRKHWSAVITRCGDNIRLISVRRARDEEMEVYEGDEI